jgi:hypothetical protein
MPTAEYLDDIITEYYDGSAWVDISAYVVGDIKGNNGLGGWRPENRVAVLGILNITINNKSKQFSPMGGDAARGLSTLTGWNKGAKIRVRGTYLHSIDEEIWTGRIASIDSDDLNWGNEQVRVMAVDYMNVPANFPMKNSAILLNYGIRAALNAILPRLSIQPEATDFDAGLFTYPAVLDNVQRKTMALSEFTKLANSELGYIYVTQDGTLREENMLARHGWRALDQVYIPKDIGYLKLEDGLGFLLLETGGKIILDEVGTTEDAALATDMEGHNILLPEDGLLNASIIRAHPVITDTSLKVLYKLGTPLLVPVGVARPFSAHYTDPNGLSQVSGTNMQAPVATTDYLANTAADGSGTNKTTDVVVTATYYGDTVYYSILNNATTPVYITFLQARGYGIYYGNSIESTKEDAASQADYGYFPFQFDMKYQKNAYLADMYGQAVIEEYKFPKSRITKMNYLANLNKNHLVSFLMLTIGSLILGTEDRSGISNHYYITDRAFTIKQGGIIHVEYGIKQNDSYLSGGLEPVTVEFNASGTSDRIDFGSMPHINGQDKITASAWVYVEPAATSEVLFIWDGMTLGISPVSKYIWWYQLHQTTVATYQTPNNSVTTGAWSHFVYQRDSSNPATPAVLYINGVSQTITTSSSPSGSVVHDGNLLWIGGAYNGSPFYGKVFDPRIYNRILTAAEVLTLSNAGVSDHTLVTDGLVFQGFATYADRPLTAGTVLTSTDRLVENIIRAVGVPNGSPTIR